MTHHTHSGMLASDIAISYLEKRGAHAAGSMQRAQIKAIERVYLKRGFSMETGCGTSTILLSNISDRHLVFCADDRYDERSKDNSSIDFVRASPALNTSRTEFIIGPTQKTLPTFNFTKKLDLALLDGPHAYPFPDLEYYFVYLHLKTGAILIIDDVHIPTLSNLYRFLLDDDMFSLIERLENTAFFRRTDAPIFNPFGDGWEFQEFNKRRFQKHIALDERLIRLAPQWLSRSIPRRLRTAIRRQLARHS